MFKIESKGDEVRVHVALTERKMARDPHISVDTGQVLDFLKTSGYNLNTIEIEQQSHCSTTGNNPTLKGTWVFSKKKEEKNVKSVKSTTRKRSSTRTQKATTQKDKLLRNEDVDRVQSQAQVSVSGQNKKVSRQ